ncbi:MAG: GNAT family N-acetyltransferase [Deltaproteobacteria bacterium]|nr:GNAT family N-acetyltransferase [Deltaproteobacteria bacterium]
MIRSELSLKLARLADARAIAVMSRELIEYGLQWRWTVKRVEASIRAVNVNVLVARLDDRIVGFGIMRYGDDDAHLDLFAVAAEHRRSGIGRQLLEWLEKCATIGGIFHIALEVRDSNQGAQQFYERMSYRAQKQLPGYYQGMEAAVHMSRDLAAKPDSSPPKL